MKTIEPTSLEAYKNMQPKIPTDHELILAVLSEEKAMTYNEIAKAVRLYFYNLKNTTDAQAWLNPNKVSRRLKELVIDNKAIYGEVRKCTIAKSSCKTYLKKKLT